MKEFLIAVSLKNEFKSFTTYSLYNNTVIKTFCKTEARAISNTKHQLFEEIRRQNQDIRILQTKLQLRKRISDIFEFDVILN